MAKKEVKENKQKSHYFKDTKAELKKVIWPTPKQLINNTMAVIVFTLIVAVIVFVLDLCFDAINTYGITAMQEKIQTSYTESHESSEENAENEETSDENTEAQDDENISAEVEETVEDETSVESNTNNTESQE